MSEVVIHTEGGSYKIPSEELSKYKITDEDVAGFTDPFGGIIDHVRTGNALTATLGSAPVVTEGTRIIFSAETMIISTPVR